MSAREKSIGKTHRKPPLRFHMHHLHFIAQESEIRKERAGEKQKLQMEGMS